MLTLTADLVLSVDISFLKRVQCKRFVNWKASLEVAFTTLPVLRVRELLSEQIIPGFI